MLRTNPATAAEGCFHCGLPIASDALFAHEAGGRWRRFCCAGCEAISHAISGRGLDDYYRLRTAPAATAPENTRDDLALYDDAVVQQRFVRTLPDGTREAELVIEGMRCAACAWLVEQSIARVPGVRCVTVNATTRRALVTAREMSPVFRAVRDVGYQAWPYEQERVARIEDGERRALLRRLWVAGLCMMQVMMYAVPAYIGAGDVTADAASLMRWAGLILTLPVLLYCAAPFFAGAWRGMRARRAGMDLPVALGISVAFAASGWSTVRGTGEVYFDSITMFVFLLLGGRWLEQRARLRAGRDLHHLAAWIPQSACRVRDAHDATGDVVPASSLRPGDLVLIRPGETVPADGLLAADGAAVSEALLTGESRTLERGRGERIVGGSVNAGAAFVMRVTRVGADTVLCALRRLIERAASQRPASVEMAERAATAFVGVVLLASLAGLAAWWPADPSRAVWIAVSVLIVTCPCALSLATPVAITVATGAMARGHFAVTRAGAVERLAAVTDVVFDKTGTLTRGAPALQEILVFGAQKAPECLRAAAGIGRLTSHPLDRALVEAAGPFDGTIREHRIATGRGAEARVDGQRLRLGQAAFVREITRTAPPLALLPHADTLVWLGGEDGWWAAFRLADTLRPEAAAAVTALRALGLEVHMLSGDGEQPARSAAERAGIDHVRARATPADKAAFVARLQDAGARVAMVGDGLNDAPVLACADVSIAMGCAADVAQVEADAVLLSNSLHDLVQAVRVARATRRVARQNLGWALGYNLLAIPMALAGAVTPLAAAVGMSASSLLVVLNALRLARKPRA